MVTFPNAKINLGLNIVSKRPDGFHNLESCFYPIPWCDILEIIPAKELKFEVTGVEIPGDISNNLCMKAFRLLKEAYKIPNVHIHLHKILPTGAGLGGGSADASFTLTSLNDIFELGLSKKQLEGYASQLGSDCPFFVGNSPVYAEGKGHDFSDITVQLSGMHIIIIKPDIHVPTATAYAGIKPAPALYDLKSVIETQPIERWSTLLKNDFEKSIFDQYPEIKAIKAQLYAHGAMYASMSGSGAAVYGLFKKQPEPLSVAESYVQWQGSL